MPLMVWFAMESLVADHPKEALTAALKTPLPKILNFSTRRIALLGTDESRNLIGAKLDGLNDSAKQLDMLAGLSAALKGQRNVSMPTNWETVETKLAASANSEVRALGETVSLTFGSKKALASLHDVLGDSSAPTATRRSALDALTAAKDPELPRKLPPLLRDPALRGAALRALGTYNDPEAPVAILGIYPSLDTAQKRDALNTLASRPSYARALLAALADGKVPSKDFTADIIRQLRTHKDPQLQAEVAKVYGSAREVTEDKKADIERYKAVYRRGGSQPGNASPGRVVFNRVCAQCHTLFDTGGKVGPDITGANRTDLNYLLETIVDPNAVIPNEYRATEIETKDGRSLTGLVKSKTDKAVALQTANELLTIPQGDIASMRQSELSMMPEGLLSPLTEQEVRDLLYYLSRSGQVPLPVENAANAGGK